MTSLLALSLAYAGLGSICFAMPRHQRQVSGDNMRALPRFGLRVAGWLLLGLSFYACVLAWGVAIGSVAWFGMLTVSGLILAFLLPYAARTAAILTVIPLLLSGIAVALLQI